ncbi:MAG: nuclear transport factor 2 family protein [Anaerolineae bacterium]
MNTTKEGQIIGVMNEFLNVWASRDMDALMSYWSPNATLYGTGMDEKRVGKDEVQLQIERDFAQSEEFSCTLDWNQVGTNGNVAWIASDVTLMVKVPGAHEMSVPARLSTVMQNYDGRWLFEHFHLSVAAAGQDEGESF